MENIDLKRSQEILVGLKAHLAYREEIQVPGDIELTAHWAEVRQAIQNLEQCLERRKAGEKRRTFTNSQKVLDVQQWLKYLQNESSRCNNCCAHIREDLNIAAKELDGTKWPYQKLEDKVAEILDKHSRPDGTGDWAAANKELDPVFYEAGWDHEEYHWECIRHNTSSPRFCACWDVAPENKGRNPLPL